jgi:hypothetical protein
MPFTNSPVLFFRPNYLNNKAFSQLPLDSLVQAPPAGRYVQTNWVCQVRANLSSPQGVRSVGPKLFENLIFCQSSATAFSVLGHPPSI